MCCFPDISSNPLSNERSCPSCSDLSNYYICVADVDSRMDDHGMCCDLRRDDSSKSDMGMGYVGEEKDFSPLQLEARKLRRKLCLVMSFTAALWILFGISLVFFPRQSATIVFASKSLSLRMGWIESEENENSLQRNQDRLQELKAIEESEGTMMKTLISLLSKIDSDISTTQEKRMEIEEQVEQQMIERASRMAESRPPTIIMGPVYCLGCMCLFVGFLAWSYRKEQSFLIQQRNSSLFVQFYVFMSVSMGFVAYSANSSQEDSPEFMIYMLIFSLVMCMFWNGIKNDISSLLFKENLSSENKLEDSDLSE